MLSKFKLYKEESGQALVIVALMLTVLMGVAALAVDVGMMTYTKTKLQNAADAAALAGAQDLPTASIAKNTAIYCAGENGVKAPDDTVTPTTPYFDPLTKKTDSTKIEVECKRTVPHIFARILGFTDTEVSARAVAQQSSWAGDALPFINLDGDGEDSTKGATLTGWNMVGPGDKERIHNNDLVVNTNSIKVKYEDGFLLYKKGKDMSDIKGPLDNILVVGKTIYMFSLKHDEMANYEKKGSKELKEGDQIPIGDTVLLECKVTAWNGKIVTLEFENSYDISKNIFPRVTGSSKLMG